MAAIWAKEDFNAEEAAETLRDAMKGLGTNEADIIAVIASCSNEQRREIEEKFKQSYGKDLIDDLKDELGGDFEESVIALMTAPALYDARQLNNAVSGAGTCESTLIEIMCSRTNEQLDAIKEVYEAEFETSLEDALQGDTSGYFRRLMVSVCTGARDQSDEIDGDKAQEDAQKIYDAGEGQMGTDEAELMSVLCTQNANQLTKVFDIYKEISDNDIEDAISSETSGTLQDGYLAIVRMARSPPRFFAGRLNAALSGLGTDDTELIRIIATRSEIDLADIRDAYQEMYEKSLEDAISDDCGGDYKNMLLAIVKSEYM